MYTSVAPKSTSRTSLSTQLYESRPYDQPKHIQVLCISVIAQVLGQPVYRTLKEDAGKSMAPLKEKFSFVYLYHLTIKIGPAEVLISF